MLAAPYADIICDRTEFADFTIVYATVISAIRILSHSYVYKMTSALSSGIPCKHRIF